MTRLTDVVLRHRLLVALMWLVVAVAGGATASTTVDRLTFDFDLPGQAAYETNQQIVEQFVGGGGLNDPLLLVVDGADAAGQADRVAELAREALPGTHTVAPGDAGADALSVADDSAVVIVYPPVVPGPDPYAEAVPALEKVAASAGGDTEVTVSGFSVLEAGGGSDRGLVVEVLIGAAGALIVLALVFGSLLAGLPLLVAAVSILGTFLALLGLTFLTDVSAVVEYLVALIGLGVAIDYSLLMVTRWREEIAKGVANEDAVRTAMATAGRSVVFSGTTVAISLAALALVPIPFLRSIGFGGLLIPLFSVAISLTLVPALLSSVGPRLSWPRRGKAAVTRSRLWAAIATGVLRRRWLTVVGSVAVLVALAAPVLTLTLGTAQLSGVSSDSSASQALTGVLDDGLPAGVVRPTEVVVPAGEAQGAAGRFGAVDGVAAAFAPDGDGWTSSGQRLLQVWSTDDPTSDAGRATLERIRATADDLDGVAVGGTPAEDADYISAVYGNVVWVVLAVAVVTFLLLARALRSLWLPIKALGLNALSLAAAYGVTVLIWQHGVGTELIFDQTASGAITIWVPIAAFAFLFGLSMDYEVFLLSRMREEHDSLMASESGEALDENEATDRAVVEGIANTGRLVTSAALILFFAFIALSTVPALEVKVLATALALGIAIDAVIVRGLLAPALVGVLGRANWTLPDRLRRVLLLR